MNKDRNATESLLKRVRSAGVRTLFLTVDCPVAGKREADERVKADETLSTPMTAAQAVDDRRGSGLARTMCTDREDRLQWDDVGWLRRIWGGKIVIKGVMTADDASRAASEGVNGIVLR